MFLTNKITKLNSLATDAGKIIMDYYKEDIAHEIKSDKSPVTAADIAANDFIVKGLQEIAPEIPIVSEEAGHNHGTIPDSEYFWLVDPLDGTKSFIRKKGDFTVNIALIKNLKPLLGVIYSPVRDLLYYSDGNASYKKTGDDLRRIKVSSPDRKLGFKFVVSHSHLDPKTEEFVSRHKVSGRESAASSIKFCLIAEGIADIYPRFGRTMEWDTAAGHAIVNSAGGEVVNIDGSEFLYGKKDFENPAFIARAKM